MNSNFEYSHIFNTPLSLWYPFLFLSLHPFIINLSSISISWGLLALKIGVNNRLMRALLADVVLNFFTKNKATPQSMWSSDPENGKNQNCMIKIPPLVWSVLPLNNMIQQYLVSVVKESVNMTWQKVTNTLTTQMYSNIRLKLLHN